MKCLVVDDEETSRMVVKTFVERTQGLVLEAECENAIEALDKLKQTNIDIMFLDVEMPQMNGIELIKSLTTFPQIILITSRKEYGAEAYEYGLTDYLVKPITYARFLKAVEKARQNLEKDILETQGSKDIYVKADNKIVRIQLEDIYFIEALSDYVLINVETKKYIVHSTMKNIEKRLASAKFIRVHRSFIINIDKIETIEDMSILMPQKSIPIGNSYKNSFLERLNFL